MDDLIKRLEELHSKTNGRPLEIWSGNPWFAFDPKGSNAATPNTYHILAADGGPSEFAKDNLAFAAALWNAYPEIIAALRARTQEGG